MALEAEVTDRDNLAVVGSELRNKKKKKEKIEERKKI